LKGIVIRRIKTDELHFLEGMLYEAIYQPESETLLPREIIKTPEIDVFINNFGKQQDDHCLVADLNGKIIGAVWVRILSGKIKGYGNIDNETPEFAISLFQEYRNKGYGTQMMKKMIEYLIEKGYKQTSLSVDKNNYAVRMYQKLGFETIQENEHDYIMLLKLR
jgi:ribosomal protein S18 acetylase RimI-like enzyme